MERVSGLDASFLYNETPTLHMHTLKFAVLDVSSLPGGYDFSRFRAELEPRLHLLPPFRRRVVEVPGRLHHPVWVEDPNFDLDHHLRRVGVPPPGDPRSVDDVIADIASWPLDRRRPLWEIWVLEGLEGGKVGFLAKIHHAVADGVAAAELLANVMTVGQEPSEPPPGDGWRGEPLPGRWHLLVAALFDLVRTLAAVPALLKRTVVGIRRAGRHRKIVDADAAPPVPLLHTPKTPFNGALTAQRSFATTTVSLEDVKRVKSAFDVTVNDVVLAMVGASLRGYLDRRGALPDRPLVAGVPVATPAPGDEGPRLSGNRVSNLFTSLRTDVVDPVERLRAISAVTRSAKEIHELMGTETLAQWMEVTPPGPFAGVMRLYSRLRLADRHRPPINLVVSNVPGPRQPLYIAGARLDGIWSVGPILEGVGLNVTVWSYLDNLNVGVIACRDQVRDPHEITDGMGTALDELLGRIRPTSDAPS
jgi:diacylglycerol O-acyltransferase